LQLATSSGIPSVQYEGLAAYPTILAEPEDLLDLEWSNIVPETEPNRVRYESAQAEYMARAFASSELSATTPPESEIQIHGYEEESRRKSPNGETNPNVDSYECRSNSVYYRD
jgi:hypothetical protein